MGNRMSSERADNSYAHPLLVASEQDQASSSSQEAISLTTFGNQPLPHSPSRLGDGRSYSHVPSSPSSSIASQSFSSRSSLSSSSPSNDSFFTKSSSSNSLLASSSTSLRRENQDVFIALPADDGYGDLSIWQSTLPDDILLHIFSFLEHNTLRRTATVCTRWNQFAFDASLWHVFHLCPKPHKINDHTISSIFSRRTYSQMELLCLDRCAAITDSSLEIIANACPNLVYLSLVACNRLSASGLLNCVRSLPNLRKLEIYGQDQFDILTVIRFIWKEFPDLQFGFAHMQFCGAEGCLVSDHIRYDLDVARPTVHEDEYHPPDFLNHTSTANLDLHVGQPTSSSESTQSNRTSSSMADINRAGSALAAPPPTSIREDGLVVAQCRHIFRLGTTLPAVTACIGPVKGRLALSNNFYHCKGMFPHAVVFSCQEHSNLDLTDNDYAQCQVCDHLIEKKCMSTDVSCKACEDDAFFNDPDSWIQLSQLAKYNSMATLLTTAISVNDSRNFPLSLNYIGSVSSWQGANVSNENRDRATRNMDYTHHRLASLSNERDQAGKTFPRTSTVYPSFDGESMYIDSEYNPLSTPRGATPRTRRIPRPQSLSSLAFQELQRFLNQAQAEGYSRAVLMWDGINCNFDIWADYRLTAQGQEGEKHIITVTQTWDYLTSILSVLALALIISGTAVILKRVSTDAATHRTYINYLVYIHPSSGIPALLQPSVFAILTIGGGFLFGILMYRLCRAGCIRAVFTLFPILLFLASAYGFYIILTTYALYFQIPCDFLTLTVIIVQLAGGLVWCMYKPISENLHNFFLLLWDCIFTVTISAYVDNFAIFLPIIFVSVNAVIEVFYMSRLPPIFVPQAHLFVQGVSPVLIYTFGDVLIRPFQVLFCCICVTYISSTSVAVFYLVTVFCFVVFLSPFYFPNRRIYARPLPVLFFLTIVLYLLCPLVIQPFQQTYAISI